MKNNKIKIVLLSALLLQGFVTANTAHAAQSSLYVTPSSSAKSAGEAFNISASFGAAGNKVCAVEGTIVFANLACQSITLSGEVVAQSAPTCSNPHFLVGVPNCSTDDKTILTASVQAGTAGPASVSFTGVDIVGEGASIGTSSTNGNYTISAAAKMAPATYGYVGYMNGQVKVFSTREAAEEAGATGIEPNYQRNPSTTTTQKTTTSVKTPTKSPSATEVSETSDTSSDGLSEDGETPLVPKQNAEEMMPSAADSRTPWVLLAMMTLVSIAQGIYIFQNRKRV